MQLKTILNRVQKFKSFVYGNIVWLDSDQNLALLVEVVARANSRPICSGCGCAGPGYSLILELSERSPRWLLRRYVPASSGGIGWARVPARS
jgi:hypothetical protein